MSVGETIQIVGHGLAGAILAETLSDAGFTIRVRDDGGPASSRVAAGLYTPLTGQKLTPSWRVEDALPIVNTWYPALENTLRASFFHPIDTLRIFSTEKQRREWEAKQEPAFTQEADCSDIPFHTPHGGLRVTGGGWVHLPLMLDALRHRRESRGEWGEHSAPDLTVWAEGARGESNPLWKDVGWRNAHGDVLTVRIPGLAEDVIYSFGRFLLPVGKELFRYGATYAWNQDSPEPRARGREELEQQLRETLTLPFETVDHSAGIRPVALARVPVAGPHPEQPDQWIFNGFGSKGVLMAPWMAQRLRDALREERDLPKQTRAARRIQRQRDRLQTARHQAKQKTAPGH